MNYIFLASLKNIGAKAENLFEKKKKEAEELAAEKKRAAEELIAEQARKTAETFNQTKSELETKAAETGN